MRLDIWIKCNRALRLLTVPVLRGYIIFSPLKYERNIALLVPTRMPRTADISLIKLLKFLSLSSSDFNYRFSGTNSPIFKYKHLTFKMGNEIENC